MRPVARSPSVTEGKGRDSGAGSVRQRCSGVPTQARSASARSTWTHFGGKAPRRFGETISANRSDQTANSGLTLAWTVSIRRWWELAPMAASAMLDRRLASGSNRAVESFGICSNGLHVAAPTI